MYEKRNWICRQRRRYSEMKKWKNNAEKKHAESSNSSGGGGDADDVDVGIYEHAEMTKNGTEYNNVRAIDHVQCHRSALSRTHSNPSEPITPCARGAIYTCSSALSFYISPCWFFFFVFGWLSLSGSATTLHTRVFLAEKDFSFRNEMFVCETHTKRIHAVWMASP